MGIKVVLSFWKTDEGEKVDKMRKLLNILICGFSLLVIEYFILLIFSQLENIIKYSVPFTKFSGALRDTSEVSVVRFIFYFTFWILAIYFLFDKINIKYPVLKLALLNCALYIIISGVMTLFFPFPKEYFKETFFYFLVIATLLSPFILSVIPMASKLIKSVGSEPIIP